MARDGDRFFKRARYFIWNSILGLLVFLLVNNVWPKLGMPILWWPLLLAVIFGIPGALAAILLWLVIR